MSVRKRGMASIWLGILSGLLALKGYLVMQTLKTVDGAGIGITFLGFEVNDRVLTSEIMSYAYGFWIVSGAVLLVAMILAGSIKPQKLKGIKTPESV
ncbi:hypothetical protein [Jeotgalibacillus aurantiacus]|uniref:hypothetical protein n=1 Tax=Jeotgalibacillus aurantiacus TaxID=2763266 RepID=UPI001D0B73CB|nr:hypothetical protein [Jeotgalibacillus aurantiacus]